MHLGDQIAHYESVDAKHGVTMPESIKTHAHQIDGKLAEVTVCDPAVGSGAFPVGMMTEIVRARCALTPYFNDFHERTPYFFKRHAIQNCLYGVDIDGGAVDIAKLRLWLSLVVDEEQVEHIKPLPNLDYRVVTGNSLLGFPYKSHGLREIEQLKREFFDSTDSLAKAELKAAIDRKLKSCLEDSKKAVGYEVNFDYQVSFSEVFRAKGGFDVVIGNPPYVSYGLRGGQSLEAKDRAYLKKAFPNSAEYKISLYAVFMEKGIRLCSPDGGTNSFIVPDSFVLGMYFSKIRDYILHSCLMRSILLLPFSVFKSVVGFSIVYEFERRNRVDGSFLFTASTAPDVVAVERRQFTQYSYAQSFFSGQKRSKFRLFFEPRSKRLVEKCEDGCVRLGSLLSLRSGLIGKNGQEAIVSRSRAGPTWRPGIVSGAEIGRYTVSPEGYYLLYDRSEIKSGYDCVDYFAPKIFMRQTGDSLVCAYDDKGLLCLNNVHVGNLSNSQAPAQFLVGLLNSRLLNWFYQTIALEVGRVMPQTDIETLDDLPVRLGTLVDEISQKAGEILTAKAHGETADTSALEAEVDRLVYGLYGLTKEDIALVETSTATHTSCLQRAGRGGAE